MTTIQTNRENDNECPRLCTARANVWRLARAGTISPQPSEPLYLKQGRILYFAATRNEIKYTHFLQVKPKNKFLENENDCRKRFVKKHFEHFSNI